jgi:signal recognition particle subunit SRP19
MKERGWQRLYPAYFDLDKTRREGRRVARELAVSKPRLEELAEAVKQLGLEAKVVEGTRYSRCWWGPQGMVLVRRGMRKEELLRMVARAMKEARVKLERGRR